MSREGPPLLGGTRYALRRLGLFLALGGAFFVTTRLLAGWIGCPGQYITGVPCDLGVGDGEAHAAIPPLSYPEILRRSSVLVRVGADGLVAESFKGDLAIGSKPPAGSLGGTAAPAMLGRTDGGWYARTIGPTGLVALHPPGREYRPPPVTLAQIRALAKTGVLPPYVVRATLRWPKSPVTRELEVTWNGDGADGPLAVKGLPLAFPIETYGSVGETWVRFSFAKGTKTLRIELDVTRSDGDAIVATLKKTDPPTASAKELDALVPR